MEQFSNAHNHLIMHNEIFESTENLEMTFFFVLLSTHFCHKKMILESTFMPLSLQSNLKGINVDSKNKVSLHSSKNLESYPPIREATTTESFKSKLNLWSFFTFF